MSYATRFGIARLTNEIRIGSQLAIADEPVAFKGANFQKEVALSSLRAFAF